MSKPTIAAGSDSVELSSVDEVIAVLRAQGGRATSSRRVLLEVLFGAEGHMSADQLCDAIQARLPDVHVSTIYRNLDELQRLGVLAHSHLGHGPATYQLASLAHTHFLCKACGATVEAPDRMFAGLARQARSEFGFTIDPHHFAILGLCAACSS